jgi:hypothetical protein
MKNAYMARKALFATTTCTPTATDQAGAAEADINRIVKSMGIHGQTPTNGKTPMYGDFTHFPDDLRTAIATAQSLHKHMQMLPEELRNISPEDLYNLTPNEILARLTKPATTTDPPAPVATQQAT